MAGSGGDCGPVRGDMSAGEAASTLATVPPFVSVELLSCGSKAFPGAELKAVEEADKTKGMSH